MSYVYIQNIMGSIKLIYIAEYTHFPPFVVTCMHQLSLQSQTGNNLILK